MDGALAAVGRTEDLSFSPANDRLALAAFERGSIVLVGVRVAPPPSPAIELLDVVDLALPNGGYPHGLDWLDDETLVVADREGSIAVVRLRLDHHGRPAAFEPCPLEGGFSGTRSPGSVVVVPDEGGGPEVLVCNNYAGTVTGHRVSPGASSDALAVRDDRILVRRWLDVPDGVAISADGRWLAVSNHIPHLVMVYDRRLPFGPDRAPDGVLRGVQYPHGLAFSDDGGHLLVADAGRPLVVAFAATDGSWSGSRLPVAVLRAMDDATFERGRVRPQEGGPKGLALDRTGTVLAVTSEHQTLAIHDAREVVRPDRHPPAPEDLLAADLLDLEERSQQRADGDALRAAVATAEQRAVDAERQAHAALAIAREADARARAASSPERRP